MSFLSVIIPSLVLTAIIGTLLPMIWPKARTPWPRVFVGLAILVHVLWAAIPRLGPAAPVARWLAIVWLGSMLTALMLLIPFALVTLLLTRYKFNNSSAFLPIAYVAVSLIAGLILSLTSTSFIVRQEDIRITDLPEALEGFRIANLGDVHIGRFIDAKELCRGIEAINNQKVDLLVVTGDLVDDVMQLDSAMRCLEQSNTSSKVVAILGNHEEMGELPKILSIYDQHKSRIVLLVNQNIALTRNGVTLRVVGVDYPMNPKGGHFLPPPEQNTAMGAQADAAFAGLPTGETVLALSHHPAFFPFAAAHGAQLTLASHTHGAQMELFGRPLIDAYPYRRGPYRLGDANLDVSAGFGHWFPIRFGVSREIVIVTLSAQPRR